MVRLRQYLKNIVCFESIWDEDLENRLSMLPVMELVARITSAKFIFLTCNTKAELRHNLALMEKKKNYGILVLAFHGDPGKIELGDKFVSLDSLAHMMGKRFAGWVVHIATCGTVKIDESKLERFVGLTGVAMVTGYTKSVDWTEGAAMDMLLLRWLQYYVDLRAFWKHMRKNYPSLLRLTGLQVYPKP